MQKIEHIGSVELGQGVSNDEQTKRITNAILNVIPKLNSRFANNGFDVKAILFRGINLSKVVKNNSNVFNIFARNRLQLLKAGKLDTGDGTIKAYTFEEIEEQINQYQQDRLNNKGFNESVSEEYDESILHVSPYRLHDSGNNIIPIVDDAILSDAFLDNVDGTVKDSKTSIPPSFAIILYNRESFETTKWKYQYQLKSNTNVTSALLGILELAI